MWNIIDEDAEREKYDLWRAKELSNAFRDREKLKEKKEAAEALRHRGYDNLEIACLLDVSEVVVDYWQDDEKYGKQIAYEESLQRRYREEGKFEEKRTTARKLREIGWSIEKIADFLEAREIDVKCWSGETKYCQFDDDMKTQILNLDDV